MTKDVVFDDRVLQGILRHVKRMDRAHVKVGVLASKGGDAKHEGSDFSLIELMAVHEYGSADGHIPDRAPMRLTFETTQEDFAQFIAKLARAVVMNQMSLVKALTLLGMKGVAEIKKTITQSDLPPPLKAATIARKGSDRPLVDTGQLINSIQYEVIDAE